MAFIFLPMYVCVCQAVPERELREAVAAGARDLEALSESLGVCTGCGTCREAVEALIDEHRMEPAAGLGYAA